MAAEFTKRPSWSQLVLGGLPDFLHVLTPDRRILYASPSCKAVTGFEPTELQGRFVSAFIHPEDYDSFLDALNEMVSRRGPVRFIYRFRRADREWTALEASGHAHVSHDPNFTWHPHRGFFMMARSYFSNDRTLFDSFLELKIENERLLARKAELEYEEEAYQVAEGEEWKDTGSDSVNTPLEARTCMDDSLADADRMASQMISIAPDAATQPLLPQKLAEMIFMEPSSQMVNTAYQHHEAQDARKSCTNCSFTGDVGIQISMHGSNRKRAAKTRVQNSKKKHLQGLESYICMHCSTLVSPEWRKGPDGPKTLCNACGCKLVESDGLVVAKCDSALVQRREET
jgi:PAS domain S-box-containing protein